MSCRNANFLTVPQGMSKNCEFHEIPIWSRISDTCTKYREGFMAAQYF